MHTNLQPGPQPSVPTNLRPLRTRMIHEVDLRIPGFLRSVPQGSVLQRALSPDPTEPQFEKFCQTLVSAVNSRHFPVFRFGDGESYYSVGHRLPPYGPEYGGRIGYIKRFLSAYVKHRQQWRFVSGSRGYGYELYTHREWNRGREYFVKYVKDIAKSGIVSFIFVRQFGTPFCENYFGPVCEWLDDNDIAVHENNSVPVYFVYGALLGENRITLLKNRSVLIVTSLNDSKAESLRFSLTRDGASCVQFLSISRSKAMFDSINLRALKYPVDVALVGAGVGAANVLHQLKPLGTLCIDCGYVLDCYAEPSRKGSRVFTLPDSEMQ